MNTYFRKGDGKHQPSLNFLDKNDHAKAIGSCSRYMLLLLLTAFFICCVNDKNRKVTAESPDLTEKAFTLPEVPDSLTVPEERADFLLLHFWERMDFSDDTLVNDSAFMSQSFSNFILQMVSATDMGVEKGIENFIDRAKSNTKSLLLISGMAQRYLYDPDSPLKDDKLYLLFGDNLLKTLSLPKSEVENIRLSMKIAAMNMVDTEANELEYKEKNGSVKSLRKTQRNEFIVLFFYDPDCPSCDSYIERMEEEARLKTMIDDGSIVLLALCAAGDEGEWRSKSAAMPDIWKHGFITESQRDKERFYLPFLPVFYVVDRENKVVVKDGDLQTLLFFLQDQQEGNGEHAKQ
ncbi:MAG: DUF5106 domain-containing protein [Muribaculaceae bacterium]|nr:DUF5106 domain-containing protein [Muribaculaceae bacterium]